MKLLNSSGIEMQCSQGATYCSVPQPTVYFNRWDHFSLYCDAFFLLRSLLLHPKSQRWLLLPFHLRNAGSLTSELSHLNSLSKRQWCENKSAASTAHLNRCVRPSVVAGLCPLCLSGHEGVKHLSLERSSCGFGGLCCWLPVT